MDEELAKCDLYDILKANRFANEKQLKKAYKKQALQLHPDKNPDNLKAASEFQLLQKAFEFLSDVKKKAAYDNQLRAKDAATERRREMDAHKRHLIEVLEEREASAKKLKKSEIEFRKLEQMRKDARRELEEEREKLLKKHEINLKELKLKSQESQNFQKMELSEENKIKVKWKNDFYNETDLKKIFLKYGSIEEVVFVGQKKMALIEFSTKTSALESVLCERGTSDDPLTVNWLIPPKSQPSNPTQTSNSSNSQQPTENRDFESIVLMRMRQAGERDQLIQQMKLQDEDDG